MRTLINNNYWSILEVFYMNGNRKIHLRELSRKIGLNEGPLSRHLNKMENEGILTSFREGNLKKFYIKPEMIKDTYTLFDIERYNQLPSIRKNAIKFYITALKEKPILLLLFGSTAKGSQKQESDIDMIAVFNRKKDNSAAIRHAEAQTGIRINEFQMPYMDFMNELRLKKDNVIQAGISTGFPVYNHVYYYGMMRDGLSNT